MSNPFNFYKDLKKVKNRGVKSGGTIKVKMLLKRLEKAGKL